MTSFFPLWVYGNFFWLSRAANSVVGGQIWPKFELIQDIVHVLIICKFEKDRINSNGEKVVTSETQGKQNIWSSSDKSR